MRSGTLRARNPLHRDLGKLNIDEMFCSFSMPVLRSLHPGGPKVGMDPTVLHPTHDNLHWASRDLTIQLLPSHYTTGQLILRCLAEVGTIYSEVSQAPLESSRKEPIPERVPPLLTPVLLLSSLRGWPVQQPSSSAASLSLLVNAKTTDTIYAELLWLSMVVFVPLLLASPAGLEHRNDDHGRLL
uniref:Uncharacterized protein n=1 Tax=Anopheles atroparvus TaxID=41427 RepID=A0A182IJS6_ANOAO